MDFPLQGVDLCLRPWQSSDAIAFQEATLESVSTVGRWMNWCHAGYSLADAESWIMQCQANLEAGISYELGIFSADGAILYGGIGINDIRRLHMVANVGYWVRENRQQHGIALDALRLTLAFGLQELHMQRLEIVAAESNQPSRTVAEKAGAVFEGLQRKRLLIHGVAHTAAMYSVVAED
ncbi:GNAT family N-acetyltransferase [Massilia sp. W12]|uniref:GNAT family N-acetyltransferase n=1 Tax=Massilia sp. W12 TaxID=3126507 RepID=UPI0030D38936